MVWLTKMNDALQYIEQNLAGKIDYQKAAQIACSSPTRFQRMFIFMTDMTVGDYVRARRMTLAAQDLLDSDIKIVDLSAKYGYESPEAFSRTFRAFHGSSPSAARKFGTIRACSPIIFEIRTQNGDTMLGRKPMIRLEELTRQKVVIFSANCPQPETRAWNLMREWAVRNLKDYSVRRYIGFAPQGHHADSPEETAHEYCAMMLLHSGECEMDNTYLGAEVVNAPAGLFFVGDVVLNEYFDDGTIDIGLSLKNASQTIYECMLHIDSYVLDFDERTYLEEHIFHPDWFTSPTPEKILPEYRFWLPVQKNSI